MASLHFGSKGSMRVTRNGVVCDSEFRSKRMVNLSLVLLSCFQISREKLITPLGLSSTAVRRFFSSSISMVETSLAPVSKEQTWPTTMKEEVPEDDG